MVYQYTGCSVPSGFDAIGVALASSGVTVNGVSADYRRGEYFQKSVSVANSSTPVWQNVSVTSGTTAQSGNVFVPATPEGFTYDADGNLLTDGRWTYTWDGANRLISQVARTAVGPQQKMAFDYDYVGRRIRKQVWGNTAGSGTPTTDIRYVYDTWNLMAEYDGNRPDFATHRPDIFRQYFVDPTTTLNGGLLDLIEMNKIKEVIGKVKSRPRTNNGPDEARDFRAFAVARLDCPRTGYDSKDPGGGSSSWRLWSLFLLRRPTVYRDT